MGGKRNILFTTGIRSEYDILAAVMAAVDRHPALAAQVVVTGAHLSPMYGHTDAEVVRDGFRVVSRIESLLNSDSKAGRVKSAAIQLTGLVDVFTRERPDFVIAMADREEALTVAMAGAYLSIPVAHIGGGDTAADGNIDNAVRHAVTKLAHMHLVTTPGSAERVTRMGEDPWRVHVVGAPGLDRILAVPQRTREELGTILGWDISRRPLALVVQHSIIDQAEQAGEQMRTTLNALTGMGAFSIVSYPNSDVGSQRIIAVIEEFAARFPDRLHAYRNLPREAFVNVLRSIDVMVGNSSCGIIEAPLLRIPVINVGRRQVGREHSENVIFVDHEERQIVAAVRRALEDAAFKKQVAECRNPYGDGHAGERIATLLAETQIDDRLIYKRNTY
ncbi:MAG: UDP-N-acetylglucosamine 2-epimerase [Gemmatimonadales bacterium]